MRAHQRIDRNSPIPYYYQLKQLLLTDIVESDRRPGDRLPGDEALSALYGVSRTVVRQALSELEKAGVIVREKGRGTFVAPATDEGLVTRLSGWYDDLAVGGPPYSPRDSSRVHRLVVGPADDHQAADLQLTAGTPVVHLERIRYAAGEPTVYTVIDVPYDLAPGLEHENLADRPLVEVLRTDFGIQPSRARRVVHATGAHGCIAQLLEVGENEPLLVLRGVSYDENDRPLLCLVGFHRADRSRLEVELRRTPG